jgi:hypothetical protein
MTYAYCPSGVNPTPLVAELTEKSVLTTVFVATSIIETVSAPAFATYSHCPFGDTAIPSGSVPAPPRTIGVPAVSVVASIGVTLSSRLVAT